MERKAQQDKRRNEPFPPNSQSGRADDEDKLPFTAANYFIAGVPPPPSPSKNEDDSSNPWFSIRNLLLPICHAHIFIESCIYVMFLVLSYRARKSLALFWIRGYIGPGNAFWWLRIYILFLHIFLLFQPVLQVVNSHSERGSAEISNLSFHIHLCVDTLSCILLLDRVKAQCYFHSANRTPQHSPLSFSLPPRVSEIQWIPDSIFMAADARSWPL